MLASCGEDQGGAGEGEEPAGQASSVSVAVVTHDPGEFYGAQMTLSGLVTELVGPNAVAIPP